MSKNYELKVNKYSKYINVQLLAFIFAEIEVLKGNKSFK